jgi:hypothetical protein
MTNKTLSELYRDHNGKSSDKWSSYLVEYNELFSTYKSRPINLLEIGIQNGGSLEIWAKYFDQSKKIIGCDINPRCDLLTYDDPRISVLVGDANSEEIEKRILGIADEFDIVIDDGSHTSSDIIKSFARYFKHVVVGGVYVVEDLHCSYWREFGGGLYDPLSSLSFFKRLVDVIHSEHWGIAKSQIAILHTFREKYGVIFDAKDLEQIHSLEFINSICVIRKRAAEGNVSGLRQIVGDVELVESNVKQFHNSVGIPPFQKDNTWSNLKQPFEQEVIENLARIPELTAKLKATENVVNEQVATIRGIEDHLKKCKSVSNSLKDQLTQTLAKGEQQEIKLIAAEDETRHALHQLLIVNSEIVRLLAERSTFGAQIGRFITRLRSKIAPMESSRGDIVTLAAKFARSLFRVGIKATVIRGLNLVAFWLRSKPSTKLSSGNSNNETAKTALPRFSGVQSGVSELEQWFSKNEPTDSVLNEQRRNAKSFKYQPLISVIVPIYKLPLDVLEETIKCLERQTYEIWEACIVWSDVDDIAGWHWLQNRCKADARFKCKLLKANGGISRNSNEVNTSRYLIMTIRLQLGRFTKPLNSYKLHPN